MPCLTKEVIGTKFVTVFSGNRKIPKLHSIVILTSSETGEMLAILGFYNK